ncbi:energy-coupling factor transporter transmembrane component T [Microbacterium horticulturae]|uniref:Energy-coupling factor transporter transmembrane component T n=1 Tax=Microbacterium horticulturae TaxID=3028316 RepID=A0ABY8BYG6_9MICO|nr:energy-coupling factor transporter transmembrane component T [Microbacterium sp. KACC 23027]WEG09249.1 energy-coupling factor transporter transmembrane component T [Microbacterium sp. KACC 23027]
MSAGSPTDLRRHLVGPLAQRNPSVKLALLFAVSLVLLFVFDVPTLAALYVVAVAAVLAARAVPPRTLALGHVPFIAFALGLFVANMLTRPGTVLWQAGLLRVTQEGLDVGLALALRTLATGVLSIAFIVSTDPVALMTSAHQHLRLDIRVASALLAGYRMLQTMGAEWQTIRAAHLVRAPIGRNGMPRLGAAGHLAAASALLIGSLRRGERLARALEQRGLGLSPRTIWRPVALTARDALFAGGVLAALAAVLVASASAGTLTGPGALFGAG